MAITFQSSQSALDVVKEGIRLPELQMNRPLHANLGHITIVKQNICDSRDEDEYQARGCEKEGAQVCSLSGLGDSSMNRYERCVLHLSYQIHFSRPWRSRAYHSFTQRRALIIIVIHQIDGSSWEG